MEDHALDAYRQAEDEAYAAYKCRLQAALDAWLAGRMTKDAYDQESKAARRRYLAARGRAATTHLTGRAS